MRSGLLRATGGEDESEQQDSHASVYPNVLELFGQTVDALDRGGDPAGHLAGLVDRLHQRFDVRLVLGVRQPITGALRPFLVGDHRAIGRELQRAPHADLAMELVARQLHLEIAALLLERLVPAIDAALTILDVLGAKHFVECGAHRDILVNDLAVAEHVHRERRADQLVLVVAVFFVATLETGGERIGRVRRHLAAEEIQRQRVPEVQILLDRLEIDAALPAHIAGLHQLRGALAHALDARFTDEHVMRFFGQHEATGAREWIEAALGERGELILAIAIREHREHEEREPVRGGLVERAEDARLVGIARSTLQQLFRLVAPVATEVRVQQVDHRPQVTAFFHVHLEQIAEVVQRRCRATERTLLLDARRLGITLRDDEAAEAVAELARNFIPHRLALEIAKAVDAAFDLRLEEDAPAILRHLHVIEVGPAIGLDRDGGAQVDVLRHPALGTHLLPPVDELRLPRFERALEALVAREIDVIRNLVVGDDC